MDNFRRVPSGNKEAQGTKLTIIFNENFSLPPQNQLFIKVFTFLHFLLFKSPLGLKVI